MSDVGRRTENYVDLRKNGGKVAKELQAKKVKNQKRQKPK
jgi:hypothetical protein